jgi:hypothetical protein
VAAVLAAGVLLPVLAWGAKTTETTAGGDWSGSIWSAGAPEAGDTVLIHHSITLSNETPALAAYALDAGVTHLLQFEKSACS